MATWKNFEIHVDDSSTYTPKQVDKEVASIKNESGVGRERALCIIFDLGMEARQEKKNKGEIILASERKQFILDMEAEAKDRERLEKAYRKLGAERFVEKSIEDGKSPEELEFYLRVLRVPSASSWYEQTKRWMVWYINNKGGEADVNNIKEDAIQAGVLVDPSKDEKEHNRQWQNMKTAANELGLTSRHHRGWWTAIAESDDLPIQ